MRGYDASPFGDRSTPMAISSTARKSNSPPGGSGVVAGGRGFTVAHRGELLWWIGLPSYNESDRAVWMLQ